MTAEKNAIATSDRPVLIYDGECGFCEYWARYWQKLTGETVDYKPYQEIGGRYPHLTADDFQKAVQYVSSDGKTVSAAEASFTTLSHAKGKSFWLWMYRFIPGFAFISEMIYRFISKHRPRFYKISLFLWGKNHEPADYDIVSWFFLRLLGIVLAIAFLSFGVQAMGLIGSNGILPLAEFTTAARNQIGASAYWNYPMVFWLNDSDRAIRFVCWGGFAASVMLTIGFLPRICLLACYVLYLSLIYAGQNFMTFQWDVLLIETIFLAFLLCFARKQAIWLLHFLAFRFFFLAGMVKIASGDATWRNLTALEYHFQTQPLPTSLAWHMHFLPESILSFLAFMTLFVELIVPFLVFAPRHLRFFAAFCFAALQIIILLTGNYNFFNLNALLLCLVLLDDQILKRLLPQRVVTAITTSRTCLPQQTGRALQMTIAGITLWVILVSGTLFQMKFYGRAPAVLAEAHAVLSPFVLVNSYGPFAVMTVTRPEIIIEGSNDGVYWQEYDFKYKPDALTDTPRWNIPHQPRVDWQMWFAALDNPGNNPWFSHFLGALLTAKPDVLALIGNNPFPNKPPRYLRALLYEYVFADPKTRNKEGVFWQRKLLNTYFPQAYLINTTSVTEQKRK